MAECLSTVSIRPVSGSHNSWDSSAVPREEPNSRKACEHNQLAILACSYWRLCWEMAHWKRFL
jgi:hypothetical protein